MSKPVLLLLSALSLLAVVGCKKESASSEIIVGHYASMTGKEANFGIATDRGVRLALKERNAKGGVKGKQIKVITYDDAGKQQEAATSVDRLIKSDNAVAILGEVASGLSLSGAEICQRQGVPMISPSSTNPQVTEKGDMIFRVCFIDPFQGFVGATFAHDTMHAKVAATLYNQSQAYSTGLNAEFVKAFEKLGGKIVTQQAFADGANTFDAQLRAIATADPKPQVIYVPVYYSEIVQIAPRAKEITGLPLLGGDGWTSGSLADAGSALDGCFFSDHYSHEDQRPEVQEFLKRFAAEYDGAIPDSMAALGYDAANLLFDAMERSPSLNGKDLAKAIAATKDFKGVTGTITLDERGDVKSKLAVIQRLQDGKFSFYAKIDPPK